MLVSLDCIEIFTTSQELLSEVEIMLTTTLLPDRCTLLVEETIPRGAYVDPDQIRDLRYKVGLR